MTPVFPSNTRCIKPLKRNQLSLNSCQPPRESLKNGGKLPSRWTRHLRTDCIFILDKNFKNLKQYWIYPPGITKESIRPLLFLGARGQRNKIKLIGYPEGSPFPPFFLSLLLFLLFKREEKETDRQTSMSERNNQLPPIHSFSPWAIPARARTETFLSQ